MTMTPPKFPAGERTPNASPTAEERTAFIAEIAKLPTTLTKLIAGLSTEQLGEKYVNWTVCQIISHLADSHMNAFFRFKWALTEDNPTIKPYKPSDWASTVEAIETPPTESIALLTALHARWVRLLQSLSETDFARTFVNPVDGKTYGLGEMLGIYAWHGRHHGAQIIWIREQNSW